jgi:pyruvate-formate lyase
MWPYYKASVIDKTAQPMTRDEAIELCESERLKICERGVVRGRITREGLPGVNDLHIVTLGGLDEHGNDTCNDLTDAILECCLNIHTNEPSMAIRYSPKLNEKTRRLTYECISQGLGFPSIKHDEKCTRQCIEHYGWAPDEAAHWCLILCMAPGVSKRRGTQKSRTEGGAGWYPFQCMNLALADGFDYALTGRQEGAHTGDATKFETFEEVVNAWLEQWKFGAMYFHMARDFTRRAEMRWMEGPFLSLMDDFCVEDGVGAYENKKWSNPWHDPMCPPSVGDDLTAIKYWIFDKKKYTMEDLVKALRANWGEGYEDMRRDFLAAPKWGNDDPYADEITRMVFSKIADVVNEQRQYTSSEIEPMPVPQSVSYFSMLAPRIGAEACGRKHGEVLHDGGCSPYVGWDKKGPTAVLKSMSKIPQERYKGIQFNQRLPVGLMRESEKGFDVWTAYMKTWHDFNIDHVQFNVVNSGDMRAAQKEPEKWQHLIVRIAGYSARFVTMPKLAQDAIIGRTEQQIG